MTAVKGEMHLSDNAAQRHDGECGEAVVTGASTSTPLPMKADTLQAGNEQLAILQTEKVVHQPSAPITEVLHETQEGADQAVPIDESTQRVGENRLLPSDLEAGSIPASSISNPTLEVDKVVRAASSSSHLWVYY
jgi:hypothetical protein